MIPSRPGPTVKNSGKTIAGTPHRPAVESPRSNGAYAQVNFLSSTRLLPFRNPRNASVFDPEQSCCLELALQGGVLSKSLGCLQFRQNPPAGSWATTRICSDPRLSRGRPKQASQIKRRHSCDQLGCQAEPHWRLLIRVANMSGAHDKQDFGFSRPI